MEPIIFSSQDRRSIEMLRALRHLPPGTSLPQIRAREDRELFQQLLSLPDETNVFLWVQQHASSEIIKIALRILILQLRNLHNDVIIASSRVALDTYYQQMLGGFLEHTEDILPFDRQEALDNSPDAESLLRQVLHEMQSLYRKAPVPAFQARNERDQIWAGLLRLSENIDPLDWLQKNHEKFATRLVLSHLLDRFRVTHGSVATLPTVHSTKVNRTFYPMPAVRVRIREIIFKTVGFLARADIDIAPHKLSLSGDPAPSMFVWQGFESVEDNSGYRYLTWAEEIHSGNISFHRYQEQLTMAFYPSIAENSKTLTFRSQPMILETSAFQREGHLLPLPEIVVGDLVWSLSLGNMPRPGKNDEIIHY